jgi:hypothetical protein
VGAVVRQSWLIAVAAALLVSGCAAPVIGTLTLNELSSGTSLASTGLTGKSLSELALSWATGKDCRFMEGLLREDRKICEERDSPATDKDFNGLLGLVSDTRSGPQTQAGAFLDPGVFLEPGSFRAGAAPDAAQ